MRAALADVDLDRQRAFREPQRSASRRERTWEKDTKTHQQRRIALDPETRGARGAPRAVHDRAQRSASSSAARCVHVLVGGRRLDAPRPTRSASATAVWPQRLGIETTAHKLRHYSATELIAGGVDVRTVAGRLGHGGGGTTTLRVYAAGCPRRTSEPPRAWPIACRPGRNGSRIVLNTPRPTRGVHTRSSPWSYRAESRGRHDSTRRTSPDRQRARRRVRRSDRYGSASSDPAPDLGSR